MGLFYSHTVICNSKAMNKRGQILKIINSNNKKSQTYLDSSSDIFFAIDLTLSDLSNFIEYNWRVYKKPLVTMTIIQK